jgi:DNA-binding GntR family transcriptional regulator
MSVTENLEPTRTRVRLGRVSTIDAIVNELRGEILDGSLPAGTRLREVELANRFGVSRQSVRAALAELSFRGLARREPNRGVQIPTLSREDVADIFVFREVIEGAAIRRIVRNHAPLDAVDAEVRKLERLGGKVSWSDVVDADVAIHRAMVAAAASPRLLASADRLSGEMLLVGVPARRYMSPARMAGEHRELLEAIQRGDPEAAVARLREHLELGTEDLLANLAPAPARHGG